MLRTIFFLLAVAVLLLADDAAAREWRGCSAQLRLEAPGTIVLWSFEGRGSCRSRVYANDCRRAARSAILACVRDSWAIRWERRLSGSCVSAEGSGSNRPYVKGIFNTNFGRGNGAKGDQDFKWAIEHKLCCEIAPTARTVTARVGVHIFGDAGCWREGAGRPDTMDVVEGNYVADCQAARAQGFCAVRTNR
jgi:hypothetical protein